MKSLQHLERKGKAIETILIIILVVIVLGGGIGYYRR
jgi:flagellar basal body-associated protein FliL